MEAAAAAAAAAARLKLHSSNTLPEEMTPSQLLLIFCRHLKTVLFENHIQTSSCELTYYCVTNQAESQKDALCVC